MKFLLNLIPAPYRFGAAIAGLIFIAVASASLGGWGAWKIATWRANDAWQDKVTELETSVTNLKQDVQDRDTSIKGLQASIKTQNDAIAALELATAETARLQAEARKAAEVQAKAAAKRVADLQRMLKSGATPEDAMKAYWEASAPNRQETRQ